MPLNSPPSSDKQHQQRMMIERCSTLKKACEQCRRRRRVCNSQRPCAHCTEENVDCVYSVVPDHSRSVFSTQAARRLSSGSACETCRRRKTKCDGGNPCNFCATNNIECVNHSEKRQQKSNQNTKQPVEAMDRIEDRLRRIERLMTAFTPSPLSTHHESHKVRPHRHSVQGINVSKEQVDIKRRGSPYSSSSRYGSLSPPPPPTAAAAAAAASTPVSIMRPSNSHTSIAHSMLNLSISPSSSSSSCTNQIPFTSTSTPSPTGVWPISPPHSSGASHHLPSPPNSARSNNEWKTSGTIPSLMDQLSKRTFATSAVDYTLTHYPIYPLTPPPSQSRQTSPPNT
ncbi:hypothetical protein INT47_006004 [Mucor saturninus]|uniref:Zn(2)-C6 fungal-type domain-containing protein n=1 Tax=Mucor saturninus TaxID=64648 RepID=A0A8H7QHE8_9FUNG|nr:hypothetical protein INT47_006004 [Mucor saturninus]